MKLQVKVDGRAYDVEVDVVEEEQEAQPEPRAPLSPRPPVAVSQSYPVPTAGDPKVCRSPVMGLVIKVNVQPGQSVETGDLMMVLEAMKMETNVAAPAAATVKTVHVREGDSVKLNQPLMEFD